MFNQTILAGRLGRDPETRRMGNGDPVVTLRLATSETWKDKSTGERKDRTQWHTVVIFNTALCDIAERYLRKGSTCQIVGQVEYRKWQDQSGQDKWSTEIVLRQFRGDLTLLDRAEKPDRNPDAYGTTSTRESGSSFGRTTGSSPASTGGYSKDLDDDIPF